MYVLMITPNKFPEGDAGAVRDYYFAKIYKALGYEVYHIGMGKEIEIGEYHGICFYSLYKKCDSITDKITFNMQYQKKIESIFVCLVKKFGLPNLIHIYDIPNSGIEWVRTIAKNKNICVIHDSVEWYSACEFKNGKLSYPYIKKNITNRFLIRKPFTVIAISSYLERHFQSKGLTTLRIPVIMDSKEYKPFDTENEDRINMIYAGSPASKDYLSECIQAFELLTESDRERFSFKIFGVEEDFVKECCSDNCIPKQIEIYGRVPRKTVIKSLEKADFSILLRPSEERYTKAGFPTKSVEAMMCGCAMICNISSDLGLYLKDGENAIIVEQCSVEAMNKAFQRVSELTKQQIAKLKVSARITAENNFDYSLYIDSLAKIIEMKTKNR